jgi:hypothetical protein
VKAPVYLNALALDVGESNLGITERFPNEFGAALRPRPFPLPEGGHGADLYVDPPIALVAVPWLFFGLLLTGPLALLVTLVILLGTGTGSAPGVFLLIGQRSRRACSRRRSFSLARRIARAMTGPAIFLKPAGSPQLRNVIRVEPSSASANS